MFWLKGCPRCQGDLQEESDVYGKYAICIQCGHLQNHGSEINPRYRYQSGRRGRPRKSDRKIA
jgi:hypothetical protein